MSDDRDYRPEALSVGDEIRWMGSWCRIMGVHHASGYTTALRLLHGNRWFTVIYRAGCWVAARPQGVTA